MPLHIRRWYWFLAAGSLLLAGCSGPRDSRSPLNSVAPPASGGPFTNQSPDEIAEAHAHYGAAIIHELNEEPEQALNEYYEAALNDPGNSDLVIEVSRRLLRASQPEKALELLTRATARASAPGELYAWLGIVHARLGQMDAAISADRAAIRKQPDSLAGYQNLFVTYLQNQEQQKAFDVLDEARRVSHADAAFFIELGELYQRASSQFPAQKESARKKALEVFHRAQKMTETDPELRVRLADGLNSLGDKDAAAEIYRDLLKQFDDEPFMRESIRTKLVDIYIQNNDSKGAEEQLQEILHDNPTDPQVYSLLGSIAYSGKQYQRAADYFSKAVLLDPDAQEHYYDLTRAQMAAGKNSDALETLNRVRGRFPQSYPLEFFSGLVCSQLKNYSNAITHFTTASILAGSTNTNLLPEIYFQLGAAFEREGRYSDAADYFQKCLSITPDDAEALNYLGYMWAEHGENLERARGFIERALKNDPNSAAYLDSMAWVLYKLGQPKQALDYIEKAIKLSEEEDATLYDHLGDIYARLGQSEKARAAWQKSLSLEPNDQVRGKLGPAD